MRKPKKTQEKRINLKLAVEQISKEIKEIHRTIARLTSMVEKKDRKAAMQIKEFTTRKLYRIAYMSELEFDAFDDDHARSIWQKINLDELEKETEEFSKAGVELKNDLLHLHQFNRVDKDGRLTPVMLSFFLGKKGRS